MNKHAYQRGQHAAKLWKRLSSTLKRWEMRCTSKARQHRLPAWTGKIPVLLFIALSVLLLFAGSAFLIFLGIVFWALLLMAPVAKYSAPPPTSHEPEDEESYRHKHGSDGSNGSDGSSGS